MILGVDHLGIRVVDSARSEAFYEKLGFTVVARHPPANVVILRNEHGVEINLIVNAEREFDGTNVLMDAPPKRAGFTHVALRVGSIEETVKRLGELGIAISDGPVRLGGGTSLFVRDPDRNVIELRGS
jgi:lactoylglutathione lyase